MTNEEKIKAARAALAREWRRKNPEKFKEQQARYLLRKYDELCASKDGDKA